MQMAYAFRSARLRARVSATRSSEANSIPSEYGQPEAADRSDRRLHCEDGAEPGLPLRNTLVGLRCLCQWIRLYNRFDFSVRYEIKRFIKIFGTVLLASNYSNALRDEICQRDRKRLRVGAHGDQPAVGPQSLYAVHHSLGRI